MTVIAYGDSALSAPGSAPGVADTTSGVKSLYTFDHLGLANGAAVNTVTPVGGTRGLSLTEPTTPPILLTNALNGHAVLDFTRASSQKIRSAVFAAGAEGVPPLTQVIVGRRKVTTSAGNFLTGGVQASVAKSLSIECEGTAYLARGGSVSGGNLPLGTPDTAWHIMVYVVNGASSRFHIDGAVVPGTITAATENAFPRISLGCNASGTANYLDGQIAYMQEFDRALTVEDVAKLRHDLKVKYAIAT